MLALGVGACGYLCVCSSFWDWGAGAQAVSRAGEPSRCVARFVRGLATGLGPFFPSTLATLGVGWDHVIASKLLGRFGGLIGGGWEGDGWMGG